MPVDRVRNETDKVLQSARLINCQRLLLRVKHGRRASFRD